MPFFGEVREMACTREDIGRWLGEMMSESSVRAMDDGFEVQLPDFSIAVSVRSLPARRVGLVSLRLSRVSFGFPPERRDAAHDWIRRFDRHTQRGGG